MWTFIAYQLLDTRFAPFITLLVSDMYATHLSTSTPLLLKESLSGLNKLTAVPILTMGMSRNLVQTPSYIIVKASNKNNISLIIGFIHYNRKIAILVQVFKHLVTMVRYQSF